VYPNLKRTLVAFARKHGYFLQKNQQRCRLIIRILSTLQYTGKWNTDPVNIELGEDAKPVSSRYYPVPKINKETFRKELLCLVDIGVLTPVQDSEWGMPVFIIPKKDGTVRFITDCIAKSTN
jgi:hypothetical protein